MNRAIAMAHPMKDGIVPREMNVRIAVIHGEIVPKEMNMDLTNDIHPEEEVLKITKDEAMDVAKIGWVLDDPEGMVKVAGAIMRIATMRDDLGVTTKKPMVLAGQAIMAKVMEIIMTSDMALEDLGIINKEEDTTKGTMAGQAMMTQETRIGIVREDREIMAKDVGAITKGTTVPVD